MVRVALGEGDRLEAKGKPAGEAKSDKQRFQDSGRAGGGEGRYLPMASLIGGSASGLKSL